MWKNGNPAIETEENHPNLEILDLNSDNIEDFLSIDLKVSTPNGDNLEIITRYVLHTAAKLFDPIVFYRLS